MSSVSSLTQSQLEMAQFLRNPEVHPAPAGIEERRLKIYQDLIYNNIEGFISGGFPVLRSLYQDSDWHSLVRRFIDGHRCHTPYFLEISQEFLNFLMNDFAPRDCDPDYIAELAHYEWVELALDVSEDVIEVDQASSDVDMLENTPVISPLAWLLSYQYPVHLIGPQNRDEVSAQPTYLVVYRNREDEVKFMELNAAAARLLELVRDSEGQTGTTLLQQLATELGMSPESVVGFGNELFEQFRDLDIISGARQA